jgi:hypothetical protein
MALLNLTEAQMFDRAKLLLDQAERQFLRRDLDYQFLGIQFTQNGPNIWFTADYRGIYIQLSPSTLQFPDQAVHQIAHEVIHLLAPDRKPPAIMLEEGLATHFSIYGPEFQDSNYPTHARGFFETEPQAKNFLAALRLYEQLTAIEPNAVINLRSAEKNFHSMTPELITTIVPDVSRDLAEQLCERRQMR